jgi:hypothetical protein
MNKLLPIMLVALFFVSCGGKQTIDPEKPKDQPKKVEESKTQKTPDLSKCKEPSKEEKEQISKYLPKGFKIKEQRRVDTEPAFVFVGLFRESDYTIDLNVFRFKDGKIDKIYRLAKQEGGEYVGFSNEYDGKNFWGQKVWDDRVVCPVNFFYGGNGWAQYFIKTLMIEKGELVEPKIDMEMFTVQKGIGIQKNKPVLIVGDPRFEYFEELYRAVSPSRYFVFEPDEKGIFVNRTQNYNEGVIGEIDRLWKEINNPENTDDEEMIIGLAAGMFINAEVIKMTDTYMPIVKQTLSMDFKDKEAKRKAKNVLQLIEKSITLKTPIVNLLEYKDDTSDIRFHPIKWKTEEVK